MISIDRLYKHYGTGEARTPVLRDVSLSIDEAEFVCLIGTSGSGKTTLLNVIGGLDRDFEGTVRVAGKDIAKLGDREIASLRSETFGFVFQQFNLLDHLTSLENITLPSFFAGVDPQQAQKRGHELLEKVGLADKATARPPELSGGQKQRIAIARALFGRPTVLLCDEPTGSLDRATGIEILNIFRELNDDDITLVMVTHEEHIARMSQRIIRFEDGVLVSDTPNEPQQPEEWQIEAEPS